VCLASVKFKAIFGGLLVIPFASLEAVLLIQLLKHRLGQ
jgi:hypothetical protein